MNSIALTPELVNLIEDRVRSSLSSSRSKVVSEALRLLEAHEGASAPDPDHLRQAWSSGNASRAAGT